MKVATLNADKRDGRLVVVSEDLAWALPVPDIAPTLQAALDNWEQCEPRLDNACAALQRGERRGAAPFEPHIAHSPLPRAYLWCDASIWLSHLERCRAASGRDLPRDFYEVPAMHEGGSDVIVGPHDPMWARDDADDLDFEAEVCVITDQVEMGTSATAAARHIKLVMLANDFSLRRVQIPEMARGMGAIQGKPANAYSPVAVSPRTLGRLWQGDMLDADIHVSVNGAEVGHPNAARDAVFTFPALIAHLARTRHIAPGGIIGGGTVSNRDPGAGFACLYEKRSVEQLETGAARTPWLRFGDRVRIEALDDRRRSIFGAIEQEVRQFVPRSVTEET